MSSPPKGPHIFGIRHLSPGGAYHLRSFLNQIQPTIILIEGPSDSEAEIQYLMQADVKPPVAILAYTTELPVITLLYPFASYSPEYQALKWAGEHHIPARFIDLPTTVFLALQSFKEGQNLSPAPESGLGPVYRKWADMSGESDHESYWERYFEHNLNPDSYQIAAGEFGRCLRELDSQSRMETAEILVRESFMRRQIKETVTAGHDPDKIVVVTGAYHTPALTMDGQAMSDQEMASLPRKSSKLTLMPYSYYKLSSQSGYGAGNQAPAYFQILWECMTDDLVDRLPARYLTQIASSLRESGTYRSPAEVIEAVRLAKTLAALHEGSAPTLKDLRDAATVCLGQGDLGVIAGAAARAEVGTAIGELPEGVSQTPVQDDFNRELRRLKLERYKTVVATDLDLDLRENRRVKSEESAFLDLQRSFFLHRLELLGIPFASSRQVNQQSATWAESWILQWTPEAEIALVESTLRGETVKLATSFLLKERLDNVLKVSEAALLIRNAGECGLLDTMEQTRVKLQSLAVESGDFTEIAAATHELAIIIGYGDIRQFDAANFIPLMRQMFIKGTLLLMDAANCNNQAAGVVLFSVNQLNTVSLEHFREIDEELWLEKLSELSGRDDRNPMLSGLACALLLERNHISNEQLAGEVSRRLSPGIDADLGAGWFEGLALRNRYALLSRNTLWEQLAGYIASLEELQFRKALVYLRRAFGGFSPAEKRSIAETLGNIWGMDAMDSSDSLSRPLTEDEQKKVEALKDFDFEDI